MKVAWMHVLVSHTRNQLRHHGTPKVLSNPSNSIVTNSIHLFSIVGQSCLLTQTNDCHHHRINTSSHTYVRDTDLDITSILNKQHRHLYVQQHIIYRNRYKSMKMYVININRYKCTKKKHCYPSSPYQE